MNNVKNEFIKECIKNRKYLQFTCKDISNCLIGVTEKDYIQFEAGNYNMSMENVKRLIKVLCIEKPTFNNIETYLDFSSSDLSQDDINDIKQVASEIVGDNND